MILVKCVENAKVSTRSRLPIACAKTRRWREYRSIEPLTSQRIDDRPALRPRACSSETLRVAALARRGSHRPSQLDRSATVGAQPPRPSLGHAPRRLAEQPAYRGELIPVHVTKVAAGAGTPRRCSRCSTPAAPRPRGRHRATTGRARSSRRALGWDRAQAAGSARGSSRILPSPPGLEKKRSNAVSKTGPSSRRVTKTARSA